MSKTNINYVMAGKYKGKEIYLPPREDALRIVGSATINKTYISSYTVVDETTKEEYSFWQGALGEMLFGDMGAILGIGGKQTKEYLISIEWRRGDKSLILIDDKYYKIFVASMF